jgi:hypothetical protein
VLSKGEPLTHEDIAAWCDCRKSYIFALEKSALAKLRKVCEQRAPRRR